MAEKQHDDWWNAFVHTGRIEDYLRYRGVDISGVMAGKEKRQDAADHRRTDYPGKQQYW